MRKLFACFCLLAFLLGCCAAASAADSTTEYGLDSIYGKLSLSNKYTVLTVKNLPEHAEFLSGRGTTVDAAQADWAARGVVLQAWTTEADACLEIRLNQDEDAALYFDTDQQTASSRSAYRAAHLKGTTYANMGYSIKSAEWKKQTKGGRFLRIKYKRTVDGNTYWGYAAKTIRNGWTLVLDYQVYGRGLKSKDETSLNKAVNTVSFTEIHPLSGSAVGVLEFTSIPPEETNTGAFTVEGTCTPEAHIIGVIMKYNSATPTRIEADATKAGKFKLKVQLPQEGIWLMTLNVEVNGSIIAEEVFNTTTYQTTLLPVNLESKIPDQFETDEFVLTGTTSKGVSVQCLVVGGAKNFEKTVRTNGTGKFTFKIPTSTQSEYSITLVFQKKNYETRRFSWTANRTLSEMDIQIQYKQEAIKPAYSTLVKNLAAYTGRVMGYKVYIKEIQKVGEEWLVYCALTKTTKGTLKNIIVVTTNEEPGLSIGSEQKMYGTCVGSYDIQSEEDTVSYPCFDLLFWDSNN